MDQTPQILQKVVDVVSSPNHNHYPVPIEISLSEKYADHPDIQYFKLIKSKNHYNYHKFKKNPIKPELKDIASKSEFNPFSRQNLMGRLSTFTPLNWWCPENTIDELICAKSGWKCLSISINNDSKNHLLCTSCNKLLTLKYGDFDFELNSITDHNQVNDLLTHHYLNQLTSSGHDTNCPWINFECPVEGVYYLRPYIESNNRILIDDYLSCLYSLVQNVSIFQRDMFDDSINTQVLDSVINQSNALLIERYFSHSKENQSLSSIPKWIYTIALLGWQLKVQAFSSKLVVYLVCCQCNKRVFLHLNRSDTSIDVTESAVLTPCKYPASISSEEELIDISNEHKLWCVYSRDMIEGVSLVKYLGGVIEGEAETHTEEQSTSMAVDSDSYNYSDSYSDNTKRRKSFDINDGLERLNKLRKLYLIDE